MSSRSWAAGDYSVADIHLFRLYWRIRNFSAPDPSELPGLKAHYARMMGRPAVQKTCELERSIGYELPGWRDPATEPDRPEAKS